MASILKFELFIVRRVNLAGKVDNVNNVFVLKAQILKFGFPESSKKAQNPGIVFRI